MKCWLLKDSKNCSKWPKCKRTNYCRQKGFTLIELLIVITILGILAAVAIPKLTQFIQKGKDAAAQAELALIKTAVSTAMADAGVIVITGADAIPVTILSTVNISASPLLDLTVGSGKVGDYIASGIAVIKGKYAVGTDGTVIQIVTGQ